MNLNENEQEQPPPKYLWREYGIGNKAEPFRIARKPYINLAWLEYNES